MKTLLNSLLLWNNNGGQSGNGLKSTHCSDKTNEPW
jgi:hypothetical protein